MKNKIFMIIGISLVIIIVAISIIYKNKNNHIIGTNAKKINLSENDKVEKVIYSYTGNYIGDIYTYEIYKDKNEIKLKVIYMNINEENPDIKTIDNAFFDKFMKLIKKYNVNKWNNFHKTDTSVLDGSSFSMDIELNNEKTISFSGNNCYPENYYNFENEWLELIEKEIKVIKEKYN